MKKIVFITRHDPTKIGGGAFATRAYLEALNKIYPKQVVLFVADSYEDDELSYKSSKIIKVLPRTKLKAVLGILIGKLTRFDKIIKSWIKDNKNNIDTVIFDGGLVGGSFINIFKEYNCKLVTIHHNYEVEYHKENKSRETIKGIFFYWIKKFEKRAYLSSDINLFLTNPDLKSFKEKYGNSNSEQKVIGCFEFFKNEALAYETNNTISFNANNAIKLIISGSLVTSQTKDGVNWFLQTIYPKLKEKHKNIELTITGRSPGEELIEKCKKLGVTIIPTPKDIRKIIAEGDIYICPTRLGGGLKLRIMDALALGLPSIIQDKSFRGYENIGESNFVTKFSDEVDFFSAFDELLVNIKANSNNKDCIKNEYIKEFSFDAGVIRLKTFLK
jgi:glycosyltransferase involved in cell wall biosynthesis